MPATAAGLTGTGTKVVAEAEQMTAKFFAYDSKQKLLIVKDRQGATFDFLVREESTLQAAGTSWRFDQYLRTHFDNLPFSANQSLQIAWKPSAEGNRRVIVSVQ